MDELKNSRILITGAGGFLGKHLHRHLVEDVGAKNILAITGWGGGDGYDELNLTGYNLTDPAEVDWAILNRKLDVVFHVAGENGGLKYNLDFPAKIFMENTLMGLNVLNACRQNGVKKVVSVVASCAYPEELWLGTEYQNSPDTLREETFLEAPPHPSVAGHAYAKRNLQLASSFLNKQYGLNAVCVCPTTLFGPGDSFDPERTKVMGAMIKRFVDAVDDGLDEVQVWGSGKPLREFLYVEDAARLIVAAATKYDDSHIPLNLGTGQEISIREVAETVAAAVLFKGKIHFDASKPDGQFRKRLDLTRMKATLGHFEPTQLLDGIRATINYYRGIKK